MICVGERRKSHFKGRRRRDADAQTATSDGRNDATAVLAAEEQTTAARELLHRATETCLRVAREIVDFVENDHYGEMSRTTMPLKGCFADASSCLYCAISLMISWTTT